MGLDKTMLKVRKSDRPFAGDRKVGDRGQGRLLLACYSAHGITPAVRSAFVNNGTPIPCVQESITRQASSFAPRYPENAFFPHGHSVGLQMGANAETLRNFSGFLKRERGRVGKAGEGNNGPRPVRGGECYK